MASAVTAADRAGSDAFAAQAAPALVLTKLRPPAVRRQWVARERLLDGLRPEPGVRLIALIAPAGSGKTTLLATWLEIDATRRPMGWVSLDDADNDPVVLWSHVLESLRRVCPSFETSRVPERVAAGGITDAFLADLVNGLTEQGDVVLVLDDFHRILSGPSRDSLGWLVEHAPPSFQLVVSTRSEPALPLAALRAHGELLELRAEELGFTGEEADVLLNDRLDLGLPRNEIDELVKQTEGWPAGLYLAALSLRGVDDRHAFVSRFGGTHRHIVDFLVDEVLDSHEPALQKLMLRCSVLKRLCGPLCDALLEGDGSGEQLTKLASTNLFLVPLDDHGQWYRFHHLFGQLLRVELERREPGLAPTLHSRAYAWHRNHGSVDEAIEHALDAGSFDEAGDLISARWLDYVDVCRQASILAWLDRFPCPVLESSAVLLVVKAWILAMCAMREEAAETMAALERLQPPREGPLPDGARSVEASMATLRATLPFGDVGTGFQNAIRASELEKPQSRYWPVICWSRGVGHFFRGELTEAAPWFADAARAGPSAGMWLISGSALAYRSFIAEAQGDIEQQRLFAEQATQLARERGIVEVNGEVPLALGASLAARGQLEEARSLLAEGVMVLRSHGQPIDLAYALVRQVPVLRALGAHEEASAAVAEARATVDSCLDPGILEGWLSALEKSPREGSRQGDCELSQRELGVLRALTGPLSEREIGRELYVSHNTVHSHTRSIYRKLGVSSRAEAVERARALGLL